MLQSLLDRVLRPVDRETQKSLERKWFELSPEYRTVRQLYGRHEEGCGATVGVMPRCDFACRGCYLGEQANNARRRPVNEIKEQMESLRSYLGRWGNLQITDGEVTLLPEEELIELLRYAHRLELVPMLMTHGDTFRRQPGLLQRLVRNGGLSEISIHVDTTQRGRQGAAFRHAVRERDLHPLRTEFAAMIRAVRRETGRPLRAASTVTVTQDTLAEVPDLVRWFQENSDAFGMLSFLPAAQVGRTASGLGGNVDRRELWQSITEALESASSPQTLMDARWNLGHPDCNQILTGFACSIHTTDHADGVTRFYPLSPVDPASRQVIEALFRRFAGLTFRGDSRSQAVARGFGMLCRAPVLTALVLPAHALRWLFRFAEKRPLRFAWKLSAGRVRINRFTIVTHHFMSSEEIQSPRGQERIDHCVFRVAVDEELVSMCQFNASDARRDFYGDVGSASPECSG